DRRERCAQQIPLTGERSETLGDVRMFAQILSDLCAPLGLEDAIHIAVEIIFRDRSMAHFSLRNDTALRAMCSAAPSISCWRRSRARESRDISVPMGMLSTLAASPYERSSTATSNSTARWSSGSFASLLRTS